MISTRHPKKSMVATYLCAHRDRALDRAAQLVCHRDGQPLAVHAIEPDVAIAEAMQRVRVTPESGRAESLLHDYVRHHEADLALLRTEGAGGRRKALVGRMAETLLRRLDCDAMVVRAGVPEQCVEEKP
jgi:hypothetical protein